MHPLQYFDIPLLKDVLGTGAAPDASALHASTAPVAEVDSDLEYAALGVSGLSIVAKEILFRYTLKVGEAANSSAVIANAWQHR